MRRYRSEILAALLLVVGTLAVYWQVGHNEFVNFDDGDYVTDNRQVQQGLTAAGLGWAFTTTQASNWHPLTWLSLMLDFELSGLNPAAFHRTNLYLHAANVLLLFLALRRLTGAVWRSALVAALFAVHPLHVESVAWVAERKDMLSGLFWMLTLLAYAWYVERPGWLRYAMVVLALGLGLLAKPMLVTLPCVLLLLDVWPLRRFGASGRWRCLWEKVPLFALTVASCIITVYVQHKGGAVRALDEQWSLKVRAGNAVLAYVQYLGKTFWPMDLAVFYPHPLDTLPLWQILAAGLLLVTISGAVLWNWRSRPYLAVGWFWYLGTLVPVIGLVQVGAQATADRYTYLPLIGLFLMLAWGLPDLLPSRRSQAAVLVPSAVILLLVCLALTFAQVRHWHDSATLWEHALQVTKNNAVAHNNLGIPLLSQGRVEEAVEHFQKAVQIRGGRYAKALNNLGLAYVRQGRLEEAERHYREALRQDPNQAVTHANLGLVLGWQGKDEEARAGQETAVRLQPHVAKFRFHLARALRRLGRIEESDAEYREGLRLDANRPQAIRQTAWVFATSPNPSLRNGLEAVELALQACEATGGQDAVCLDTLAAAHAEAGHAEAEKNYTLGGTHSFERAVAAARKALELATATEQSELARQIEARLRLYERREPFRDGPRRS